MQGFHLLQRSCKGPYPSIYDFENESIGRGSFGQVYRSTHKLSKKVFAIKQITKYHRQLNRYKQFYQLEQINHQLHIMYQLDCDYIVKVYDHFQDEMNIYLMMEYVDGVELYKGIIQKKKRLDDHQIAKVIYQLCLALKHLHEKRIIHRDIKPQNIILTRAKDIKLIDFGTSNYVGPQEIRMTKTGSLPYFAPEIVRKDQHGEAVDVWCVGILLYEMFVLKTPFEENEKTEFNILKNRVVYPSIMDPEMRDLIQRILVKEPSKRLKVDEIVKHHWFIKNLHRKPITPGLALRSKSKSKQKSKSSQKKSLSKHQTPHSHKSQKSISKSLPKGSKTILYTLQQKINRLQKQLNQNAMKLKLQEQKKKVFLQRRIIQISQKVQKASRETHKYQSIVQANSNKIRQLQQEINGIDEFKKQNEKIDSYIQQKKQQFLIHSENRSQLRIKQANLETKLRLNGSTRKSSQKHSNSKSHKNNSRSKVALSSRSINNFFDANSLNKFLLTTKSEKVTTQDSARQSNMISPQSCFHLLKQNFITH